MESSFNARNLINVYHSNIKDLFSKIPGSKHLMLHSDIEVIFNKICNKKLLEKCGITNVISMTGYSINPAINKIICLLPSNYDSVKTIINMIKNDKENHISRNFVLGFVPFLSEACKFILQKEDLPLDDIGIYDLRIGWIPIDADLLTFHAPYMFSSSFLHNNTSWSYFFGEMIADAVIIGLDHPTYICQFYSLGEASDWCFQGLNDACKKNSSKFKQSDSKTGITSIFIFSRDLDYVTPFCLPITYEGMLHEVMDINLGEVLIPKEVTKESNQLEFVNSNNAVFQDIRDKPLTIVGNQLSKRREILDIQRKKVDEYKAADDLIAFVSKDMNNILLEGKQLKLFYSVYDHIIKETTINDRVDDLMSAQASLLLASDDWEFPRNLIIEFLTCRHETKLFDALRLLCLWTATHDGLPSDIYNTMYRLICHAAGYPIIYLLQNLRKLKLFAPKEDFINSSDPNDPNQGVPIMSQTANIGGQLKQIVTQSRSRFYNIRNALKLFSIKQMSSGSDEVSQSVLFGGHHIPICSAVIEKICHKIKDKKDHQVGSATDLSGKVKKNVIAPIDEAFRNLKISPSAASIYGKKTLVSGSSVRSTSRSTLETIIVCFMGGCCYAEIHALRMMAKINNLKLIILTSAILNTKSLIMQVSTDD